MGSYSIGTEQTLICLTDTVVSQELVYIEMLGYVFVLLFTIAPSGDMDF